MKVRKLAGCASSTCPAVYETDKGSYVMQGKFLSAADLSELNLGSDETAVELPASVIAEFIAQQRG